MTLILSVNSIKGGTLKTTNTVNLASCFADLGYRTLLIDMDAQGNATTYLGVDEMEIENTITNVLVPKNGYGDIQHKNLEEVVIGIKENLYLVPANLELNHALDFLGFQPRPLEVLSRVLESDVVQKLFDVVFIDNSPSWDVLTKNCVYAADYVIGTSTFEFLSLKGIDFLINKLPEIKEINTKLEYLGTIAGKANRSKHFEEVKSILEENYGLLEPIIPTGIAAADSVVEGKPVNEFDFNSKVAVAYRGITKTVIDLLVEKGSLENKVSKKKWREFLNG